MNGKRAKILRRQARIAVTQTNIQEIKKRHPYGQLAVNQGLVPPIITNDKEEIVDFVYKSMKKIYKNIKSSGGKWNISSPEFNPMI